MSHWLFGHYKTLTSLLGKKMLIFKESKIKHCVYLQIVIDTITIFSEACNPDPHTHEIHYFKT